MGARRELNRIHITGSVGIAALMGLVTGSWIAFVLMLIFLIALSVYTGDIRPKGRR
jgi:hypothetical protein